MSSILCAQLQLAVASIYRNSRDYIGFIWGLKGIYWDVSRGNGKKMECALQPAKWSTFVGLHVRGSLEFGA